MPRAAQEGELEPVFPWADWAQDLKKSPFGALFFGPDDFGSMTPRRFREHAKKHFRHMDVRVRVVGEEVLVSLDA